MVALPRLKMSCGTALCRVYRRAAASPRRFLSASHSFSTSATRGAEATIIDGKTLADDIKQVVATDINLMRKTCGKVPGLAVILVGNRRESALHVHNKTIACTETGVASSTTRFPEHVSEEEVIAAVKKYNDDPSTDGILVQLPVPQHLNDDRILSTISLEKDVDGCHPLHIGNLAQGNQPLFVPCTARACLHLLLDKGVELSGKYAVVIGCGNVTGLPISLLLQHHNTTVTRVHALTKNPEDYTRRADIVISAAGCPNLVRGNWLKQEAIVLDVGINHIQAPSSEDIQLVGDVCIAEARKVASLLSPVPGGVGPVTIAMLLQNTVMAAKLRHGLQNS